MPTRLLIVDDEPSIRWVVAEALAEEGFEVTTAENGAEAMRLLDDGREFDVIVLDLNMPVMGGEAFLETVRRRGVMTPVIVASAYGAQRAARELGAEASIDKPFDLWVLAERARRLAEGGRPGRSSDGQEAPRSG